MRINFLGPDQTLLLRPLFSLSWTTGLPQDGQRAPLMDYKPSTSTARDLKAPRMSLLNSRTSSLSRSEKVRPLPHEHSNSMRCSER